MSRKKHRGRLQAQGGGLEASESWSQDEPLTKEEGLSLLDRLRSKLSPDDRERRCRQFEEAERFIKNVKGGVRSPLRRSFQDHKTRDVRVDIEVWSGIAFLTVTLIILLVWKLH